MGNKSTSKNGPHETQRTKDIRHLAEHIKSERCKNIVLMLGAGVSTSAGIPDFRSPKTGLYSNIARLKLPHPEAVFEINFFRRNPVPFYTLAAELYPGSFRPTPTHSFIKVMESQGLLHTCFTQNIDTLERRAGVSASKIVEAHGSFATQRCVDCKTPFDDDEMRELVLGEREPGEPVRIPRCKNARCGGLVKPDIVFFGEALPDRFIESTFAIAEADILIIIGTSLTVHPFASLADMADRRSCRRVLINLERVGGIGRRPSDLVIIGECDAIIRELCAELGWHEDLERAWAETTLPPKAVVAVKGKEVEEVKVAEEAKGARQGRKDWLEAEVEKMTEAIGKQLNLDLPDEGDSVRADEAEVSQGATKTEASGTNLPTDTANR